MQTEPPYRIRNWAEYNKALIQRGSITIWIDEKAVKNWFSSSHPVELADRQHIQMKLS
jgi:heme-degrading monooxygenase HmoA